MKCSSNRLLACVLLGIAIQICLFGSSLGQDPDAKPSRQSSENARKDALLATRPQSAASADQAKQAQPQSAKSAASSAETRSPEQSVGMEVVDPRAGLREKLRERCGEVKPRIEEILKFYFQQKEHAERRSPWGLMHAMIAFGPYAEMYAEGNLVKDVDWLCQNGRGRSWRLLRLEKGQLATNNGPGRQGHEGQFLAILAQSQIPKTRTLLVEGREFTIEDLIQYEMKTCKPRTELTFKLIGLSHYIDSDATWRSEDGRLWNLERLVREELKQPINGAACGGTHRLMGYSYSLLMRKLQNKPLHGSWSRADEFVRDFRDYTFSLQNRDGSFSTDWFKSRQARTDSQRRIQTTGHILEWLVFSASEQELADPRLIRAVEYLSDLMWRERTTEWDVGPKGHAIRALRLFYERALTEPASQVAEGGVEPTAVRPFYQR